MSTLKNWLVTKQERLSFIFPVEWYVLYFVIHSPHNNKGIKAIIMLFVYISSRIYLIDPPGEDNALELDHTAPEAAHSHEKKLKEEQPKISPGFCTCLLLALIALIAVVAEFVRVPLEIVYLLADHA